MSRRRRRGTDHPLAGLAIVLGAVLLLVGITLALAWAVGR